MKGFLKYVKFLWQFSRDYLTTDVIMCCIDFTADCTREY